MGTLDLWEPPLRVWGGGIAKGRSFPQPSLDMVPCAPDHPKVKERALDSGLLLRQIRCSDSSNMAPEGKARGQARGNASGALDSLLGPRLWPKSLAVKGVKVATEEPTTSSGKVGQAGGKQSISVPCRGLGVFLTFNSSTELGVLPDRACWRTRGVPDAGGEDTESDLRKSMLPTLFYLLSPHPHPQTKHLPIYNK